MITNQLMLRKMGDFDVIQRTKDGYFNATNLLNQWNKKNPDKQRRLDKFWDITNLKELMEEIAKNELNFNSPDLGDLKKVLSKTKRGKENGGTWLEGILFIKFCMYLNPKFEYHALKFLSDQMIYFRNLSGDAYKTLAMNVQKLVGSSFIPSAMKHIGEAINWIIFNCHEKDLRNKFGSEEKQNELYQFEIKVATLIDEGFITNYDDLIKYLRSQYARRHKPF